MCKHGIIDGRRGVWVCGVCGEKIGGFVTDAYDIIGDDPNEPDTSFMAYLKDYWIDEYDASGIETLDHLWMER
jgi:hypothetical protein